MLCILKDYIYIKCIALVSVQYTTVLSKLKVVQCAVQYSVQYTVVQYRVVQC